AGNRRQHRGGTHRAAQSRQHDHSLPPTGPPGASADMNFAVVPAAGHSQRMGRPKLALPLAGRSVLEHVVTALRSGGCDPVLVVVGPHVPELVPLAESAGARVMSLLQPTADMRSTVQTGLDWLGERLHPSPDQPWLLSPGDHPTLDTDVVR